MLVTNGPYSLGVFSMLQSDPVPHGCGEKESFLKKVRLHRHWWVPFCTSDDNIADRNLFFHLDQIKKNTRNIDTHAELYKYIQMYIVSYSSQILNQGPTS